MEPVMDPTQWKPPGSWRKLLIFVAVMLVISAVLGIGEITGDGSRPKSRYEPEPRVTCNLRDGFLGSYFDCRDENGQWHDHMR